jgi:N-acetylglutamate synthase-like GNAT family acetyltransferase
MSTQVPATDEFLARETERTFYDYSFAWEGEEEQITDYADARVISLPTRWGGLDGIVERISFDPAHVDERIDALLAEIGDRNFWWIIGPSSQPADLVERLKARGWQVTINWDCLGLRDMSAEFPANPDVQVEPLSLENAADYAELCALHEPTREKYEQVKADKLVAAHRYLQIAKPEAHIYLGRVDGMAAGCVVLRNEPNGVAYLRNAETLPQFRNRGIYLTLIGHRLAVAREAGCTSAVVQAQVQSSSPILCKRGFQRVSWLQAMTRPATS